MRICLYTETALPMIGGQEHVVDALAREYVKAGHDVVVLAPNPRSSAEPSEPMPYEVVRHPRFISTRRFVSLYRRYLVRLTRRSRIDIIHCHSTYPTGYLAALAKRKTATPFVVTSHGGDITDFNAKLRLPTIRKRHQIAVESADALVAISSVTRDAYATLGSNSRPVLEIPNGVDADMFALRAKRPSALDERVSPDQYVLFLGRLSARKGVDVLLRAHARLHPERRLNLVIAGAGEECAALKEQVQQEGLAASVIFVGGVAGMTKVFLLQNALAVVMPSRDWEAFPLVVLEAFASGRPLIATRIPGVCDLVTPELTGWLVESNSVEQLADALGVVASDRALADQFGRNAREVAKQHDWSQIADRYLRLFETILDAENGK